MAYFDPRDGFFYPTLTLIVDSYMGLVATKNSIWAFVNNKGADQPAHLRRLIRAFVIRLPKRIRSKLATNEISVF